MPVRGLGAPRWPPDAERECAWLREGAGMDGKGPGAGRTGPRRPYRVAARVVQNPSSYSTHGTEYSYPFKCPDGHQDQIIRPPTSEKTIAVTA